MATEMPSKIHDIDTTPLTKITNLLAHERKLLTEFIGTFFLFLIISLSAVAGNAGEFAPLAIGIGLAGLIFASGHRSAAHFNPAVTLAFFVSKTNQRKK